MNVRRLLIVAGGAGSLLVAAAPATADFQTIVLEEDPFALDGVTPLASIPGYQGERVFNVYAQFDDPSDQCIEVLGTPTTPFALQTCGGGGFLNVMFAPGDYNDLPPLAAIVQGINPNLNWDSFMTIGVRFADDIVDPIIVQPTTPIPFAGTDPYPALNDPARFGMGWSTSATLPGAGAPNPMTVAGNYPGNRVLIMRLGLEPGDSPAGCFQIIVNEFGSGMRAIDVGFGACTPEGCEAAGDCTVPVVVCLLPPCEGGELMPSIVAGEPDDFCGDPEDTTVGPELAGTGLCDGSVQFDDLPIDQAFCHTITIPPCPEGMDVGSALLEIRIMAGPSGASCNDSLSLQAAGGGFAWGRRIGTGGPAGFCDGPDGLLAIPWTPGTVQTFCLDLAALPDADGSTTSILEQVRASGRLDIRVADDSGVDYARLTFRCCPCVTPPGDMVAWWTGDDCTAADRLGLHPGAFAGSPVCPIDAKVGNSMGEFGVAGTYVTVPDHHELDPDDGELTIDAWIKPYATDGFRPIADKIGPPGGGYQLVLADGHLQFAFCDQSVCWAPVLAPQTVDAGRWTFVAATMSREGGGVTVRLFIDGLEQASGVFAQAGTVSSGVPLLIGASPAAGSPDTFFLGLMDEVELFDRALSADEIMSIFRAGSAGKCRDCPEGASGPCLAVHPAPGCEDPNCCGQVCAAEPFCCNERWDERCVERAVVLCGEGPCEEPVVYACRAGNADGFDPTDGPEYSDPGPGLIDAMNNCTSGPLTTFDSIPTDQCWGHTFSGCWPARCGIIEGAVLVIELRAGPTIPQTDSLQIREGGTVLWSRRLEDLPDAGGTWVPGQEATFVLDLADMPLGGANLLGALEDGDLDVMVSDDTGVDHASLTVVVCPCANRIQASYLAGVPDDFDPGVMDDLPFQSVELIEELAGCQNGNQVPFDAPACNQCFGHTFAGLPCCITGATLTMHLMASSPCGTSNDSVNLELLAPDGNPKYAWGISIAALAGGSWSPGQTAVITLDLADLPPSAAGVRNILGHLQDGDLDVRIQDDTSVDYLLLEVEHCPCDGIVCIEPPGGGVWWDSFDTYPVGPLVGECGWVAFHDDPVGEGFEVTADQALSPPNSLAIDGLDDAVHGLGEITAGRWEFGAWVFVPEGMDDQQALLLFNTYPAEEGGDWSLQLELNGAEGLIRDLDSDGQRPLITGGWSNIVVIIDLDQDHMEVFYDGDPLVSRSWSEGVAPGGAVRIAAVDLYGWGSAHEVYYDDLSLAPFDPGASCPGDLDGDAVVDVDDLVTIILSWGPCPPGPGCPTDLNGDGVVDVEDLVLVILSWGSCS